MRVDISPTELDSVKAPDSKEQWFGDEEGKSLVCVFTDLAFAFFKFNMTLDYYSLSFDKSSP